MAEGSTGDHAENKNTCVHIAFPAKEELSSGASAGQCICKTGEDHSKKIPDEVAVGDRHIIVARVELAVDQIGQESEDPESQNTADQVRVFEHYNVTDRTDGAETGPLGEKADDQTCTQRDQQRSMHGSGTALTVEDGTGSFGTETRLKNCEDQQRDHDARKSPAGSFFTAVASAEIVTVF